MRLAMVGRYKSSEFEMVPTSQDSGGSTEVVQIQAKSPTSRVCGSVMVSSTASPPMARRRPYGTCYCTPHPYTFFFSAIDTNPLHGCDANCCQPRYALQLLTPASILAGLAGRPIIEVEDVGEMGELFLDAKTSAAMIGEDGGFGGRW